MLFQAPSSFAAVVVVFPQYSDFNCIHALVRLLKTVELHEESPVPHPQPPSLGINAAVSAAGQTPAGAAPPSTVSQDLSALISLFSTLDECSSSAT